MDEIYDLVQDKVGADLSAEQHEKIEEMISSNFSVKDIVKAVKAMK